MTIIFTACALLTVLNGIVVVVMARHYKNKLKFKNDEILSLKKKLDILKSTQLTSYSEFVKKITEEFIGYNDRIVKTDNNILILTECLKKIEKIFGGGDLIFKHKPPPSFE